MILTALGFRNSFRKPVRTGLSILGIGLCIMLVLTVGAVSQRYTTVVNQTYSIYSSNLIVVSKASLLVEGIPLGGTLPETASSLVEGVTGVSSVTPMLIVIDFSHLVPSNITIGIPIQNFTMFAKTGQLSLRGNYPTSNNQIVVGGYLAGVSKIVIGSVIKEDNMSLVVSGIISTSNIVLDSAVIMPIETAQSTQGYNGLVSAFLVSTDSSQASSVIQSINSQIAGVVALDPTQSEIFTNPVISSVHQINYSIGLFSELVAFLFVTIISIVNITEQKEEFITIRSIGASLGSILKVTVSEVGLIALLGVLLGLILATFAIGIIFLFFFSVPLWITITGLFSLIPIWTVIYSGVGIVGLGILVGAVTSSAMLRNLK